MVLTFKSTGVTEVYIVQKDSDGTRRIARAVQDDANPRMWNAQLEHPSGVQPCSKVYGSRGDAALALTHYLHETERDWMHEKGRSGRPGSAMLPDHNVRVDDFGNNILAPIGGRIQRS